MAIYSKNVSGNFDALLRKVNDGILNASISASLEESWHQKGIHSRCSVLVFERYSYMGGNRVSMTVTFYQEDNGPIKVCGITSGGSQAMFFKLNTFGEEAFLDTLKDVLNP